MIKGLTGGAFPPVKEVNLPAADPLVLAVGGTNLTASQASGTYIGEIAWGLPFGGPGSQFQASGGGFSHRSRGPATRMACPASRPPEGYPTSPPASPHTGMTLITARAAEPYTIRNRAAPALAHHSGPG